jgi:hypothetical protein
MRVYFLCPLLGKKKSSALELHDLCSVWNCVFEPIGQVSR